MNPQGRDVIFWIHKINLIFERSSYAVTPRVVTIILLNIRFASSMRFFYL